MDLGLGPDLLCASVLFVLLSSFMYMFLGFSYLC